MAERKTSVNIPFGRLSAGHGGSFRMKRDPFAMPGAGGPKLNRAGKTTAKVERLKSPSRELIDALPETTKRALQEKYFPRKIEDAPPSKRQLKREQRAADRDTMLEQGRTEIDDRRRARMQAFGIDPKRYGYAKGGKVQASSTHVDYGKK